MSIRSILARRSTLLITALLAGLCCAVGCKPPAPPTPQTPAAVPPAGDLPAAQLYAQAQELEHVACDGDAILLARGVNVEDDGPAFGLFDPDAEAGRVVRKDLSDPSLGPYFESLTAAVQARKKLLVPSLSADSASLLLFAARAGGGPLLIRVNGQPVRFDPRDASATTQPDRPVVGPRWWQIPVAAALLTVGENAIELRSASDAPGWRLMIAPKAGFGQGTGERAFPGLSERSADGGATWTPEKLGHEGKAAGEYCVRLLLGQYELAGRWTGPVVDLARDADTDRIRHAVTVGAIRGRIVQRTPAGTKIQWWVRSGRLAVAEGDRWSDWAPVQPDDAGEFTVPRPAGRFVQMRARLSTEDPAGSPRILGLTLVGMDVKAAPEPPGRIDVHEFPSARVWRPALSFEAGPLPGRQAAALTRRYGLSDAVRNARTEFELVLRVMRWTRQVGRQGLLMPDSRWIAGTILATRTDQPQSLPCQVVLCEGLATVGVPARIVGFMPPDAPGGPILHAVEFWSCDYDKWVLADAMAGDYFIDESTAAPLGAIELQRRFVQCGCRPGLTGADLKLRVIRDGRQLPADQAVPCWAAGALLLVPRSDFTGKPGTTPLNAVYSPAGWSGYVAWAGPEAVSAGPQVIRRVDRLGDFNWPLCRVQVEVEHGTEPGELLVYLYTQTPSLDTFLVSVDGSEWKPWTADFRWQLVPGPNCLRICERNKARRMGPVSTLTVNYVPPVEQ
ncbi:MAG: hypothetical protein BIFFINMI_03677 [Phycisphaerae bacterium]|nr:hypothetical protein [Phycisphaerae bacterium]